MARFAVSGIDVLIDGLDDMVSQYPALRDEILTAEADVIEPALRKAAPYRKGRLSESINRRKSGQAIRVGPTGEHHRYLPRRGKGIVEASYVGYINEYGLPNRNISAKQWMSKALAQSEGKAFAAADKVYDQFLKKHNL